MPGWKVLWRDEGTQWTASRSIYDENRALDLYYEKIGEKIQDVMLVEIVKKSMRG